MFYNFCWGVKLKRSIIFDRLKVALWWRKEPPGGCWQQTGQTDWTAAEREAGEGETPNRAGTVQHTMSFCGYFFFSHKSHIFSLYLYVLSWTLCFEDKIELLTCFVEESNWNLSCLSLRYTTSKTLSVMLKDVIFSAQKHCGLCLKYLRNCFVMYFFCCASCALCHSCNGQVWRMWRCCRRSWCRCRRWWTIWPVRGKKSLNISKTTTNSCRRITQIQRWDYNCQI